MIGQELDEAMDRVADALAVQGKMRKLDPDDLRSAIELWESLRPEAVLSGDEDEEVQVTMLEEEAQVAIHDRCVRLGSALSAWVRGWISQYDHGISDDELTNGLDDFRMFGRAKVGTEVGLALVKGIRLRLDGTTRIVPKYFNLSLFEGSVIAEDEFTEEEERQRRAGWVLRYILATQHDRRRHANTLLLDEDEQDYVDRLVVSIAAGTVPDHSDMDLLAYLLSKLQPNNRFFGTTQGIEELWLGQVAEVIDFLRTYPEMDLSILQEVERHMLDDVRESAKHLFGDPTLGGVLHGRCDHEVTDDHASKICSEDARDALEMVLPLAALPDLYLTKAKLLLAAEPSGQGAP